MRDSSEDKHEGGRARWQSLGLAVAWVWESGQAHGGLIWVTVGLVCATLYHPHWWWGLLGIYWLIRLRSLGPSRGRRALGWICVCLTVWLLLGWGWHHWHSSRLAPQLEGNQDQPYQVSIAPYQLQRTSTGWRAPGLMHLADGRQVPVRVVVAERVLAYSSLPQDQVLTLTGQGELRHPEGARNFGLYSPRQVLADQGIEWILSFKSPPHITNTPWALGISQGLRQWALAPLARWHDQPASWQSLVLKLLFNYQTPGFHDQAASLAMLGISHFFAISGFHLLYLRRVLSQVLLRLGFQKEGIARVIVRGLTAYAWLCGWPIGSVRVLAGWALATGLRLLKREDVSGLDRLSLIGIAYLLVRPSAIFQAGYLLSFGLSAVLLDCRDQMGDPSHWGWRQQGYCLVSCLLVTWPLMMQWRYEWYPLQGITLVVVGLLFARVIMPLALLTAVGLWAVSLTGLADGLNAIYQRLLVALQPLQPLMSWHVVTGQLNLVYLLLFLGLALWWLRQGWHHPWRTGSLILGLYVLILGLKPLLHAQASLTILDVGQGDSLVYQPAWSQEAWLIDTGGQAPYPAPKAGEPSFDWQYGTYNLIPALKAQGIGRLTGVLITHSDLDHIGSLARLSQEITIDTLWINQATAQHPVWQEITPYLQAKTRVQVMAPGHIYPIQPGMTFYTNDFTVATEPNDTSVAATLTLGRHQLLNLGDMSAPFEEALIRRYPQIQADILKCAHHGSRYSTSEALLNHVQPALAFISAGAHNTYHHPHPDTLARLEARQIPYRVTARQGAIRYWWTSWGWEGLETALPPE